MNPFLVLVVVFIVCFTGCQTASHKPGADQSEAVSALTSVSQGLTNKPVDEAQLKNLARQAATDPQAQSALRSIDTALSAEHAVKYCPVDGQHYSANLIYCPIHHVKLKWVD